MRTKERVLAQFHIFFKSPVGDAYLIFEIISVLLLPKVYSTNRYGASLRVKNS